MMSRNTLSKPQPDSASYIMSKYKLFECESVKSFSNNAICRTGPASPGLSWQIPRVLFDHARRDVTWPEVRSLWSPEILISRYIHLVSKNIFRTRKVSTRLSEIYQYILNIFLLIKLNKTLINICLSFFLDKRLYAGLKGRNFDIVFCLDERR